MSYSWGQNSIVEENQEIYLKSLSNKELLSKLFETGINTDSGIIWKPNFSERFLFENKNEVLTTVDSIYQFSDSIFVVKFLSYPDKILNLGHCCAPITGLAVLKKVNNYYLLTNFKKRAFQIGNSGFSPVLEFEKLAGYQTIKLEDYWVGGGLTRTSVSFYDIESLEYIFDYDKEFRISLYNDSNFPDQRGKRESIINQKEGNFTLEVNNYDFIKGKLIERIQRYKYIIDPNTRKAILKFRNYEF